MSVTHQSRNSQNGPVLHNLSFLSNVDTTDWRYSCATSSPSTPLANTGVDFAGTFLLRRTRGCSGIAHKAWISAFVSLVTKSVYLEVAYGYSTADFLNVFVRFTSRHGIPSHLYSGYGTNFVGAKSYFLDLVTDHLAAKYFAEHQVRAVAPKSSHYTTLWWPKGGCCQDSQTPPVSCNSRERLQST